MALIKVVPIQFVLETFWRLIECPTDETTGEDVCLLVIESGVDDTFGSTPKSLKCRFAKPPASEVLLNA